MRLHPSILLRLPNIFPYRNSILILHFSSEEIASVSISIYLLRSNPLSLSLHILETTGWNTFEIDAPPPPPPLPPLHPNLISPHSIRRYIVIRQGGNTALAMIVSVIEKNCVVEIEGES